MLPSIPYSLSGPGDTGGLCQGLPAEISRCVFHPCWRAWCCPYPGSTLVPISRLLSMVSPCRKGPVQLTLPPAYGFSFTVVSAKRCWLSDPVHAAASGAKVPLAEHAAGGLGSPGASWAEGGCLGIVQSGEMGEHCLKAFVIKSLHPSPYLHVGYIQL